MTVAESPPRPRITTSGHDRVEKPHYLPLDSVRGIAALSVVIHHVVISKTVIAAFPQKAWIDVPFFHNAWLFVDLFFVLSGMVISLNYATSDFRNFSLREFVIRRLARIYPLHIVTLVAMLMLRFARLGLVAIGILAVAPVQTEVNTGYSFFLNVFLLHSMGLLDHLSWNGPSWSISTEFYTYLLFGVLLLWAQHFGSRRLFYAASVVLVIGSVLLIVVGLGKQSLDFHTDFGFLRCVLSFFVGVLTVKIVSGLPSTSLRVLPSMLQIGSLLAALLIMCLVGSYPAISFAAPFVFAMLLGSLMAFPTAWPLPALLAVRPLVWLGKRSYSIYMVHAIVLVLAEYAIRAAGPRSIQALDSIADGAAATLLAVLVVAGVLVLSDFTYKHVELKGGKLLLRILGRDIRSPIAAVSHAGQVRS
jgi:peptidoglycan/LPS O-acetylase OafA/YrhL